MHHEGSTSIRSSACWRFKHDSCTNVFVYELNHKQFSPRRSQSAKPMPGRRRALRQKKHQAFHRGGPRVVGLEALHEVGRVWVIWLIWVQGSSKQLQTSCNYFAHASLQLIPNLVHQFELVSTSFRNSSSQKCYDRFEKVSGNKLNCTTASTNCNKLKHNHDPGSSKVLESSLARLPSDDQTAQGPRTHSARSPKWFAPSMDNMRRQGQPSAHNPSCNWPFGATLRTL